MEMEQKSKGVGYSATQWIIFCVLALIYVLSTILYSMQASIFPIEAEKKNATATEFGIVFGSYELTQLIMSPIVGVYAPKIGIFRAFNSGVLISGISTIVFGFLQFVNNRWMFIIGALLLRVIEAIGGSMIVVAIYSCIVTEFPESIPATMGAIEGILGLSFSIGPFIGSALFQVGGFILPFNVIGVLIIGVGGMVYCLLRSIGRGMKGASKDSDDKSQHGMFSLLKYAPSIYVYMFMVAISSTSNSSLLALLVVHLEQFNLTPIYNGLVFLLLGVTYAIISPIFSWLCGLIKIPEVVPLTGTILFIVGFTLIGPAAFIPLNPSLGLTLGGVTAVGCGSGCIMTPALILSIMAAESSGFSDTSQTSPQISGLWLASLSFGAFIGPIIGGVLYDFLSFPFVSLCMIGLNTIQVIGLLIFIIWKYKSSPIQTYNEEQLPLMIQKQNLNKITISK